MKTLVINIATTSRASYYDDWEDAFTSTELFNPCYIKYLNKTKDFEYINKHIQDFDFIVLLHACSADSINYLNTLLPILEKRSGKLFVFIGNEYNMPVNPMSSRISAIKSLNPEYVATQLLEETGMWLYKDIATAKIISVPHALSDKVFTPGPLSSERSIDLGVRSFRYPPYLGDDDRNNTIEKVCEYANNIGWNIDLSFTDRLNRESWAQFMQKSRFTVSSEAGTYYIRPTDDLVQEIHSFIMSKSNGVALSSQNTFLRNLAAILPYSLKSNIRSMLKYCGLKFDDDSSGVSDEVLAEIKERFFDKAEKSPYTGKCISSRHLDAMGTKTAQLLLEGDYSGIFQPEEHYISINKDYSNVEEVFIKASDSSYVKELTDRAYNYVLNHHTHRHRVEYIYSIVSTN